VNFCFQEDEAHILSPIASFSHHENPWWSSMKQTEEAERRERRRRPTGKPGVQGMMWWWVQVFFSLIHPILRAQGASNWETARATAADQPSARVVAKKEGRRGFYHHQAVTFTACGKASNPEMPTITVKKLSNKNSLLWSLGWEDPLKKEMAIHSSILAWEIPWTEEPGGLQSMGSQKSGTRLSN